MSILDRRGQATVEAAIMVPLLLFLIAGVFAAGLWLNATLTTSAAAREGARIAALTGDCASVISGIKKTMDVLDRDVNSERILVYISPDPMPNIGHDINVRVLYSTPILFNFFKNEYEKNGDNYPFGMAAGEATARMEVDAVDSQAKCGS